MENFDNSNDDFVENYPQSKLEFKGTALGVFGYLLLLSFGSTFTFGILYPFLMGVFIKYCVENTTYKGKNLRFIAEYGNLYIKFIIFMLIGLFTFGIGSIFYLYYLIKWTIESIIIVE